MTNDAKLGMLVGVLGVVVAAVLFAKPEPSPSAPEPSAPAKPAAAVTAGALPVAITPAAIISAEPPREGTALASTPVVRTRKETTAQTTSRQPEVEEP